MFLTSESYISYHSSVQSMHMHSTIKNNIIIHIWIQIIPYLSHRYIHEFYLDVTKRVRIF